MWRFSLRELILLVTTVAVALAINVWSQRDLRAQRRATELYLEQLEDYSQRLRSNLDLAKYQAAEQHAIVHSWIAQGRLLPAQQTSEGICGDSFPGVPDWSVLDESPPQR